MKKVRHHRLPPFIIPPPSSSPMTSSHVVKLRVDLGDPAPQHAKNSSHRSREPIVTIVSLHSLFRRRHHHS